MKPIDIIAICIAVTVCSVILGLFANATINQTQMTPQEIDAIAGIMGALIAILSLYVGSKLRG